MDTPTVNGNAQYHPATFASSPPRYNGPDPVKTVLNGTMRVDDEAAQLLLNVSVNSVEADPTSPPRKGLPGSTTYLHTPPDDPIPPRDPSHPPAIPGRVSSPPHDGSDAAPSPTASTKPRTKRKRNAIAGPSRQPVAITPPIDDGELPDHYLGEENSLIRCICGFDDDDGFTIQCEKCGAWEHGLCFGYMDEDMAPDKFFCELCVPRPVNREAARELQDQQRSTVPGENTGDPKAGRPRGKKPRADTIPVPPDPGLGAMKPPPAKPKRRPAQASAKPKSGKGPALATDPVSTAPTPPVGSTGNELDHPFYRVKPWLMDYTPLKTNLFRGRAAKRAMRRLYLDWADEDRDEEYTRKVESGLPSPTETGFTHPSPEAILPPPDFSTLAPPVPPVSLVGHDLASMGSIFQVKPVRNTPSFLPLSYAQVSSTSGVYSHPSLYGVFASERVGAGSLIGEFRGEVVDCETYRRDPINQYAGLGLPKPFVRSLGPPVDLMIDCRGYGTDLRFVRSACHPNAVLRPIVLRSPDPETSPRLHFGIFANADIHRKEEITLGWEWDDYHIVHALESISAHDFRSVRGIAQKFDTVLTTLYGSFSSCACKSPSRCALAQMKYIVDISDTLDKGSDQAQRSPQADLGELVGAVRGWRRREMQEHGIKQAEPLLRKRDPTAESERAPRFPDSFEQNDSASEAESPEQDGREGRDDSAELEDEDGATAEGEKDMDLDDFKEQAIARSVLEPDAMDLDTVEETSTAPFTVHDDLPRESQAEIAAAEKPRPQDRRQDQDRLVTVLKARTDTTIFEQDVECPGSSLTSIGDTNVPNGHDGNESDATTVTEARSLSSDDETTESDEEDQIVADDSEVVVMSKQSPEPGPVMLQRASSRAKPNPITSPVDVKPRSKPKLAQRKQTKKPRANGVVVSETQKHWRREEEEGDQILVEQPPEQRQELERAREPTPPPKEPTPPPVPKAPTPPPPRRVPLAEYLRSRQSNQGVVPPNETPTSEAAPAVSVPPPLQTLVASPPKPQSVASGNDEGIPGFKHYSPQKPLTELPNSIQVAPQTPVPVKVDTDASTKAFNINDYLPSRAAAQPAPTSAPMVESPASVAPTPGLGLSTRDYFPTQPVPPATPQTSSSYVPRKSSSYVPRATSSSTPAESPLIVNDHLPQSQGMSSSYIPRASPRTESLPLPPTPASYQPRQSPYRAPYALPEVKEDRQVSIPPPATREVPPHAPRPPPTGPKVPPTGPRTSGGSVGSSFPSRDWESRDLRDSRDWERDRDRDWESRDWERERDRDRDRDPVSPRAVFSAGSARGGAPVPVPFHRGRGRGGFRGGGGRNW